MEEKALEKLKDKLYEMYGDDIICTNCYYTFNEMIENAEIEALQKK